MPYLPYTGLLPSITSWDYVTPTRTFMGARYVRVTRFPSRYTHNYGVDITKPTKRDMRLATCLHRQALRVGLIKSWRDDAANKWLLDTLLGTVPNKLWFTSLLRQSEDDPTKVAYTERKKDGTYRHVKTTLAKWLGRNCPEMPEAKRKQVHENYVLFIQPTPAGLGIHFADTADEMERVYACSSVNSCMGHDADHFESPFHPVRIYAAGDLELAYHVDEDGEIDGRGLCLKDAKHYVRWYGQGESSMAKLGYTQDRKCLNGARVSLTYGEDDAEERIVAPYIDGAYEWVSVDQDGVARIGHRCEYGDCSYYCQTATSDQHGYSCPEDQDYGYALDDGGEYVTTYHDERIRRDDAVLVCDEWYHRDSDDVRYSNYHGDWYLADDVTWCEDIDEYVENDCAITVYEMTRRGLSEVMMSDRADVTHVVGLDYPVWDGDLDEAIDRGLVIEVNGDYYAHDSDKIVETENDGWARRSDCFKFDGEWYTSDSLVDESKWCVKDGELSFDDGMPLTDLINKTVCKAVAEADEANWVLAFERHGSISPMVDHVMTRLKPFRTFLISIIDGDFTALGGALNVEIRYVTTNHSTNVDTWTAQRNHRYAA